MPNQNSIQDAKEQAAEYFGFAASVQIKVGNEIFEIPNPGLLDDDQQDRWDELQFELEKCDKMPDVEHPEQKIPERTVKNEDGSETIIPAQTIPAWTEKGDFYKPYRKTDADGNTKLLKPNYNTRLAMAIFGDRYEAFKKAGGSGSQISLEWAKMNQEFQKRVESDPKSEGSSPSLEVVRESD